MKRHVHFKKSSKDDDGGHCDGEGGQPRAQECAKTAALAEKQWVAAGRPQLLADPLTAGSAAPAAAPPAAAVAAPLAADVPLTAAAAAPLAADLADAAAAQPTRSARPQRSAGLVGTQRAIACQDTGAQTREEQETARAAQAVADEQLARDHDSQRLASAAAAGGESADPYRLIGKRACRDFGGPHGVHTGTVTAFHQRHGYTIEFDDGDVVDYAKTYARRYVRDYDEQQQL
jgi:hypothetical protein